MVHIERLELKGFKSFNKKQEIEFKKGLEVFLGPNGSGKTNIKDAITFALGKLSSKDMRVEDFSKLIFHGGKGANPAKRAKVRLILNNKDKQLPVDSKKVKIQRTVGKNGRSTYRINGERTTREKILNLLSYVKVEPDGYNIINQGQVAKFVKLSSEERKEIIKDISGIGKYEKKKEGALKELKEVKKREDKAEILLKEKEERLEELKKDKARAEEFLELKEKLKVKESNLIYQKIKIEEEKKEKIKGEIKRKEKKLEGLSQRKKRIKNKIKEVKKEFKDIKEDKEELFNEKEKIRQNIQVKREDLREIEGKKNSKEEEITKTKKKLEKKREYIERLKNDIENNKERGSNLKEKLRRKKNKLGEKDQEVGETGERLQEGLKEIDDQLFQLQVKKEKAKRRKEKEEKLREKQRQLKKNKKILENLNQEIDELKAELSELKKDRELNRKKLESKKQKMRELKRKQRLTINFKRKGIKEIKDLKKRGKIKGIKGTVSELAKVEGEYSQALKVAASGRLNNIVVEDEDVASRCINHLKRTGAGVATFLPMNKIKENYKLPEELKNMEGAIDFAINLLEFNENYENIFSYVLSPTLIVEDLSAAKKIGIGRVRMVTLEGDLIAKGGSMTGGSRKKDHSIGFKEKGLRKKINETKTDISVIKEDLNHLNEKIEIKEDNLMDKREERAKRGSILENLREEVESEIEKGPSLEELKKKEKGLREKKKRKEKELRDLEFSSFEEKRQELNKIELELEETNTAIKMKESELKNSKERLRSSKEELDELKKETKRLGKKLSQKEGEISSIKEEEDKLKEKIDDIDNELGEVKEELDEKRKDLENLKDKIDALKESKNRTLIKKKEIETKLENLKSKDIEKPEEPIETPLEELKEEVKKLEGKLEDFEKVNMKAIDQYQEIKEEFENLNKKFEKIRSEKQDVLDLIKEIDKKKKEEFLSTFKEINRNFSRVFKVLTGDGEGELTLTNKEKPLSGGVEMEVRPSARKKKTSLRALSGGEKAITTLAFIFALQEYEPAPFYILDEIDAALDKENSKRLADLLGSYASDSQFILMTHNDAVIEEADDLFGVAMNKKGESRVYSISLEQ